MNIPSQLRRRLRPMAARAARAGTPLFAVGGCVRDWMLGVPTRDIDLVSEGDASALARVCVRVWGGRLESFDRFGTARAIMPGGLRLDFARARAESYPEPAALPVVRPASLHEDLRRRDFTINAMALPLDEKGGELIDPYGGALDIKRSRLRVLHEASFRDDPTRLFRAARYAGRFSLKLETQTRRLMREAVERGYPALLSRERLRQELMRALEEDDPGPALRLMRSWGLIRTFHPSFRWPRLASRAPGAHERLGLVALAMPRERGAELLASLPLDRVAAQELALALRLARLKASPRQKPSKLTREVLERAFPRLPDAALQPLFVRGEDLKKLGVPPGKEYSRWLDLAARAQWRGKFRDRAQALRWLGLRPFSSLKAPAK